MMHRQGRKRQTTDALVRRICLFNTQLFQCNKSSKNRRNFGIEKFRHKHIVRQTLQRSSTSLTANGDLDAY
ncbi:MAG: hypothetical protein RL574_566 [Actinomycetota bacterium]